MNENIEGLIRRLLIVGHEADYLEFKKNFNKDDVGERISGIANACAIADRETGYIIFGIDDKSLKIVGTDFCPDTEKFGNMPIQNWLYQFLEPKINFEFYEQNIDGRYLVLLKIPPAIDRPVLFKRRAFIRIGEVNRPLSDFPEKEKRIWNNQKNRNYENSIVAEHLTENEILNLLEYDKYFRLTKQSIPTETKQFLEKLAQDSLVIKEDAGRYKITYLGAILFGQSYPIKNDTT